MLKIPAILSTFTSLKDKTLKIVFETNEPNNEQILQIATNTQKFGYLAFKGEKFTKDELKEISKLDTNYQDTQKTPSQRLRSVLYVLYEQDNKGYKDFQSFYTYHLETLIAHFKNKLND